MATPGRRILSACVCWPVLLSLFPAPVVASAEEPAPLVTKHFIYGNLNHKVAVYVKVFRDSPVLACMDVDIALKETIDPYYIWLGPDGRNLKGHSNANITETGKLALKSFEKSMSGPYSCTLSFSSIKNNIREEKEKFKSYAFLVLAYREPDYMYQINVRFTAKPCDTAANGHFYDKLLDLVEGLVSGLTCHLTNKFYKCHVIKAPQHTLQSELFVTFRVNPFGRGWESICRGISYDCEDDSNKRVQKARDRIQEFFIEQPRVLREDFVNVPDIHYIPHSLEITRSDSCRPGFGKNEVTHHDCSGCCVVCDPGSYSASNAVQCEVCTAIRITYYGATAC